MKRNILLLVSFIVALSISACTQGESSFSSSSPSEESSSSLSSSSDISSLSIDVPSVPSKEEGVSLDTFSAEADKLVIVDQRPFRMTFQIVETVVGTYPIYRKDSSGLLSEGVYNSTLVVESVDGSQAKTKVVGERPNTTSNAEIYAYGTALDVKGWIAYHSQRRTFLNYAQEGEGFKETFYLNAFRMWMVIWGNRPSNSSVEGTYFAFEEHDRTFDENGYCKTIYCRDYRYMNGTFIRWNADPQDFNGSYNMVASGTVEYLE